MTDQNSLEYDIIRGLKEMRNGGLTVECDSIAMAVLSDYEFPHPHVFGYKKSKPTFTLDHFNYFEMRGKLKEEHLVLQDESSVYLLHPSEDTVRVGLNSTRREFINSQKLEIYMMGGLIDDDPILGKNVYELNASVRAMNCFDDNGVITLRDLIGLTPFNLLQMKNFGDHTLTEVRGLLNDCGLHLLGDSENLEDKSN